MSQPNPQPLPGGYPPSAGGARPGYLPPASPGYPAPPSSAPAAYPPPPVEPTFQVRTFKHTGAVVLWLNQPCITTGSYAQCEAAIDAAQQHCILAGWWSMGSLVWNPISLARNARARTVLRRQARQAHDYALWWATYQAGGRHFHVWAPPPTRAAYTKWWMWLPLIMIPLIVALIVAIATSKESHHSPTTPTQNPLTTITLPTLAPKATQSASR